MIGGGSVMWTGVASIGDVGVSSFAQLVVAARGPVPGNPVRERRLTFLDSVPEPDPELDSAAVPYPEKVVSSVAASELLVCVVLVLPVEDVCVERPVRALRLDCSS